MSLQCERCSQGTDVIARPKLLGADSLWQTPATSEANDNETTKTGEAALEPHPDENQIKLDTNRSFVMYPVGEDRVTDL